MSYINQLEYDQVNGYYATDLLANLLPDDSGHLISIQFYYRVLDCDFLRHGVWLEVS